MDEEKKLWILHWGFRSEDIDWDELLPIVRDSKPTDEEVLAIVRDVDWEWDPDLENSFLALYGPWSQQDPDTGRYYPRQIVAAVLPGDTDTQSYGAAPTG